MTAIWTVVCSVLHPQLGKLLTFQHRGTFWNYHITCFYLSILPSSVTFKGHNSHSHVICPYCAMVLEALVDYLGRFMDSQLHRMHRLFKKSQPNKKTPPTKTTPPVFVFWTEFLRPSERFLELQKPATWGWSNHKARSGWRLNNKYKLDYYSKPWEQGNEKKYSI